MLSNCDIAFACLKFLVSVFQTATCRMAEDEAKRTSCVEQTSVDISERRKFLKARNTIRITMKKNNCYETAAKLRRNCEHRVAAIPFSPKCKRTY